MILGVPERALTLLDRTGRPVVVDLVLEISQLVRDVDLPVGRGRVHEHDVQIKVEQVRDRGEDLAGDVVQRVQQEVHRPVRLVVAEGAQALDRDPLGDPLGPGELAARLERALRDQGEHHPLHGQRIEPATGRGLADRRADPEPLPHPVQRPGPAQPAGLQNLHLHAGSCGDGLLRREEPRDRADQPGERHPVHLLGPTEAVDHLRDRVAGIGVPLVMRQLQIAHHRTVPVRSPALPQIHANRSPHTRSPRRATRQESCAYTKRPIKQPLSALTSTNPVDQAGICLPTAEVRSEVVVPGQRRHTDRIGLHRPP